MKLSRRLQDERAFVDRSLADSVICQRCHATLHTFADACTADLADVCPGFLAIERSKKDFAAGLCAYCRGRGKVRYYHGDFDTCPDCHGNGRVSG